MKNALSDFRHTLLLILLLSTSPSVKTEVEANGGRTVKAAKIKFGRGVFNTRGLLSKSQEDSRGQIVRSDVQHPGTASNDDGPAPSVQYAPASECYPACVTGVDFYEEKLVLCIDYFGIPVHMSECDETKDSETTPYQPCPQYDCEGNWTVKLKAWTPCPDDCTEVLESGAIVPVTVDRSWECQANPKTMGNANEDCESFIEGLGLTFERECPLRPCIEYNLEASDWGTCDCKTWTQERSFHCIDNTAAKEEHHLDVCEKYGLKVGATSRKCLPEKKCESTQPTRNEGTPSEDAFDLCNYFNCSTHGTCKDNVCTCEDDFSGVDCQSDESETTECEFPSILQGNGTCCESGIYNYTGHCCAGDHAALQIDKNGDCCLGKLDFCGNCIPEEPELPEFRDIRGTCCKVLDAAGFCCPSGKVDECGVCDGLSLTCNTIVSISFQKETVMNKADNCTSALIPLLAKAMWVNDLAIEGTTVDEAKFTFTATGVIVSSRLLKKKAMNVARRYRIKAVCGAFVNVTIDRSPKCGNKVCEIGEATAKSEYHCEGDCAHDIARCKVTEDELGRSVVCNGHGSCSFKDAARCECFEGYAGDNCELCQYGFFNLDGKGSICLPRQAYVNGQSYYTPPSPVPSPDVSPVPAPGESPDESPSPSPEESPDESPSSSPGESPDESPSPSPEESPDESPSLSPVESPDESPSLSPEESPDESPSPSPEESPDESPVSSPLSSAGPSPTPGSEKVVTKGTSGQDDNDDDDGLSTGAIIGIVFACCFVLLLVILAVLYYLWKKRQSRPGYTPVPAGPGATAVGE